MNENERIPKLEKDVNEIKEDINFLKEVFEDTRKANVYYKEKNQKAKELCNKKINEYLSIVQLYGNDAEISKIAKIERDFAQEIYTILF